MGSSSSFGKIFYPGAEILKKKKPFAQNMGRKASFRDTTQIDRFRPSHCSLTR